MPRSSSSLPPAASAFACRSQSPDAVVVLCARRAEDGASGGRFVAEASSSPDDDFAADGRCAVGLWYEGWLVGSRGLLSRFASPDEAPPACCQSTELMLVSD